MSTRNTIQATPASNARLLDRQTELLRHLTSAGLIFGEDTSKAEADPSLRDMALSLLRLEAEMSFRKRIGKLSLVLRRTFAHLGQAREPILRAFATGHPPKTFKRYEDAISFSQFLTEHCRTWPADPPYILDLMKVEMALARITAYQGQDAAAGSSDPVFVADVSALRLAASADILSCDYDLRGLFEAQSLEAPAPRHNHLVVFRPGVRSGPQVMEVTETTAAMLASLREWTPRDEVPTSADSQEAIEQFLRYNIIESR